MMSKPPLFCAKQLSCMRQQHYIFENLSFDLDAGELLLVEGTNGSGKSSLLRLLTGLATPSSGDILWEGKSLHSFSFKENLHYIGHTNGIKLGLTVEENLHGTNIDAILNKLQLQQHKKTFAKSLSAGQKRKLALARLFLTPKKCWILDEPLTALDRETQKIFLSALEDHLEKGGIAVMSSHQKIELRAKVKELKLS